MKVRIYPNRISFQLSFDSSDFETEKNIYEIAKKYDAQIMLFSNGSNSLSHNRQFWHKKGTTGGSVTFHKNSCDFVQASKDFYNSLPFYLDEVRFAETLTHKRDGSLYKKPNTFQIEKDLDFFESLSSDFLNEVEQKNEKIWSDWRESKNLPLN